MIILVTLWLLAHDWYPKACCSEKDCRPVSCEAIHSVGSDWEYYGDRIAKASTGVAPDGRCHICSDPIHGIRCIFLGGLS